MAFDESKDKTLKATVLEPNEYGERLEVKLASYNGKDPQVQVSRFTESGDMRSFRKLGRMTIDEAKNVAAAIASIVEDGS